MNFNNLTDSEIKSLEEISVILGKCVLEVLVSQKRLTTENVLHQIVAEMEKVSDNDAFQLHRKALAFVGNIKNNRGKLR
ncbi:hypothetical protein [Serratia ureilytica]|uniref:hypothetical protein n=1 Tax=Serratia TaxID=613 RepID=UPI0018D7B5EA|nr:hypothetical protein [Serratia ureilytica]MBH2850770.1 hypothetical protein [Serratia marcescens]MBJ2092526.1 hypothetical protein [Serratia ureilytica]MBK5607988.1 hypothetical protein [Serratia marcescens]